MCLVSRRRGWDADRKKEKRQKLNFRPRHSTSHNRSVSQRHGKEWRQLYNDPWCRVQLVWGRGAGVVVALHPVPAVRLNLLQGRVHHSSYNAVPGTILAHKHAHTHTFSWLVWEPAALIHGLVLSFSLTHSGTFFSLKASRCKPSPLVKKEKRSCLCLSEKAEIDS